MRVRIQHFMSMRIRIQIQGFDEQKGEASALENNIQEGKSMRILIRNTSKTLYRGYRPGGSRIHPK